MGKPNVLRVVQCKLQRTQTSKHNANKELKQARQEILTLQVEYSIARSALLAEIESIHAAAASLSTSQTYALQLSVRNLKQQLEGSRTKVKTLRLRNFRLQRTCSVIKERARAAAEASYLFMSGAWTPRA
jgi:hypothetical protein